MGRVNDSNPTVSKACCLRNRLIEIRLAVLSSISHAILEIRHEVWVVPYNPCLQSLLLNYRDRWASNTS